MAESQTNRQIESLRRHVIELELHAGKGLGQVESVLPRKCQELRSTLDQLQRADRAAHESEQRFRSIVETLADGIIAFDAPGVVVLFNLAAEKIFGYPAGEVIGQNVKMLIPESRHRDYDRYMAAFLDSDEGIIIGIDPELLGRRRDRSTFPMELAVSAFMLDGRRTFTAVARDISVRKRVSEQVQRLATVLADSNDAVTVHDFEGKITAWNRGAARMYGYTDAQAMGMNIRAIVPRAREAETTALLERLARGEQIESFETERVTTDGRVLDVWLTITTLRDEAGTPVAVATTERDVTERNKAEQDLREDQRRLRSLASKLSLAEARERRRIATELHDHIGGTLSAAKIRLSALRQAVADTGLWQPLSEIRELIEKTIESTRSMTFDLASPILYEVGLEAAVESLADKIQERYGINRRFEDDGQPKPLGGESRVVLYHAVRELLANVARHAQATSVHVAVRRHEASVCIDVEDDGVGFEVPKTGFRVSRSGGFGLFHVSECLKHLGGRLEVNSKPGRGTSVTVVAPLSAAEPPDDAPTP